MTSDQELMQETPLSEDTPYLETEYEDGSVEIDFDEETVNAYLQEGVVDINNDHYQNLAEDMEDQVLNQIGAEVLERYEEDLSSRSEWMTTVSDGMNLLGIELEETNDPFPGACSAHHPLILESAVKFQAKASNELFNAKGPVKTAMFGKHTEEREAQARRVKNHMNYQIMYQMEEYFDESETMLFYLPIVGSAFKKTYYDARLDRPISQFVPVDRFIVNYYASSLKTAPCFTHSIDITSNELLKFQLNGMYRDVEFKIAPQTKQGEIEVTIDEIMGSQPTSDDDVYTLLEQYCYLDLEDDPLRDPDGVALPYVVTVEHTTGTVLSIRRNWVEGDTHHKIICPFTHYKFVPGLGFYGLGFIHLLGNLQMTLTTAMRNLVDSGAFATLQGGFVDKRLRIRNNDGPLMPGQFKEVEAGGLPLKDSVMNLPFKEPSAVLLQMYQFIEARGQKFADSTEQVVSDSTNYGKVGTTMALLEASEKFFTGVHKRLHKSQKHEFAILASLNYSYLGESETFDIIGDTFEISKNDYDGRIDVIPVSDPNTGSQAQKATLAQTVHMGAIQNPADHDMYEVNRYYYLGLGIDEEWVDKFLPPKENPEPSDPLTDIMKAQQGKPIKAFEGQNHDAHVAVKTAFLQDPNTGGNPMMSSVVPIIQANIQEHLTLRFKTQVAGTVAGGGVQASGGDMEAVIAQAAQQVAQMNQKIVELEQKGPDEARNKLADAELQRVYNETKRLQTDIQDKEAQRTFDALKLQLEKYSEDNKLVIAQMKMQQEESETRLKEMSDMIKQAMKLQAQAEEGDRKRETLTLKGNSQGSGEDVDKN